MKKTTLSMIRFTAIAVLALAMFSCGEDPVPAPTVQIFSSVDGYQVAFTATATNTDTYGWEFGDGTVSTEQNPVHIYDQSGTYTAKLTVTGKGGTADASVDVTIVASELEMLTGGPGMANGKSWVFSPSKGDGDGLFKTPPDWEEDNSVVIMDGILGMMGFPEEYEDEFIFKHDMTYTHDAGANDSCISNTIFAMLNGIEFKPSPATEAIVLAPFTPEATTFTYTEDTDFTVEVTGDDDPDNTWEVSWSDVTILEIVGGTEFIGLQDFTRKYFILDISVDHLQVGMLMSGTDGTKLNYPSHLLVMTFIPAQ
ncbi:MAG: PKD domain-containing protein [Bacteroidales bacterium]|nr:PKD domain-containing protein [Bacteroidales bacterium]